MNLKEKFDPMRLAKALGGNFGAATYGKIMGRSKEDMEKYTGIKASPVGKVGSINTTFYTTVADGATGIKSGDSLSDVATKLLVIMKTSYEDRKLRRELERNFIKEESQEELRRQEELIKAIKKQPAAKKPKKVPEKPTPPGTPTLPTPKGKTPTGKPPAGKPVEAPKTTEATKTQPPAPKPTETPKTATKAPPSEPTPKVSKAPTTESPAKPAPKVEPKVETPPAAPKPVTPKPAEVPKVETPPAAPKQAPKVEPKVEKPTAKQAPKVEAKPKGKISTAGRVAGTIGAAALITALSGGDEVKAMVIRHEGFGKEGHYGEPYKDSKGLWTIGVGHLIQPGGGTYLPDEYKDKKLSNEEMKNLFDKDYEKHKKAAEKIPGFGKLNSKGQGALIDLTYNMGPEWYKKWPLLIRQIESGDVESAGENLRKSKWYTDVKSGRGDEIINMLKSGRDDTKKLNLSEKSSGTQLDKASTENQDLKKTTKPQGNVIVNNNTTINKGGNRQTVTADDPDDTAPGMRAQNGG